MNTFLEDGRQVEGLAELKRADTKSMERMRLLRSKPTHLQNPRGSGIEVLVNE